MKLGRLSGTNRFALKQAVLIGCTLVLTLSLIEGLSRVMKGLRRVDDVPYIKVDGLYVFPPNVDAIVTGGAFVPIRVKTNADGFASPEYPVVAPPDTIRVVFLGNSFTRGFEVDYDKKFTSLAEKYLRVQDPKHHYEVMNFGIGGYGFVDQFFVYERYVKKYHPQLVVLVVNPSLDFNTARVFLKEKKYITDTPAGQLSGARLLGLKAALNDAAAAANGGRRELELTRFMKRLLAIVTERLHLLSVKQTGVLHRPVTFLYTQWLRLGLFNPVAIKAVTVGDDDRTFFNTADADSLALMRFTAGLALKLGETISHDGVKFAIVVVPNYWQVDGKYTKQLSETLPASYDIFLPNKIFRDVLGAKFSIFDLSDQIARAINSENTQIFIRDTGHFTAAGHQIVARSVVDFIALKHFFSP